MSALFYILILAAFSAAIADPELEAFAQKILESLQTNFASTQKGSNSVLLSLTNGEHLTFNLLSGANTTDKLNVNVTFSGTLQVSAQRNTKRVTISQQYGGGAALSVNDRRSGETQFQPASDVDFKESGNFIDDIYAKVQEEQNNLDDDQTGVLLAHGSRTRADVRVNQKRDDAKVEGGYIVGLKTKVTKNFQ